MSVFEKLHRASYKGALCFVEEATTTFGRQINVQGIANANRQAIEDGSLKPRDEGMRITLAAELDAEGEEIRDYFEVRDAFMEACESEGPGTLIHPFFGTIENLVAPRPIKLVQRMDELGIGRIVINWLQSDPETPRPVEVPNSSASVLLANEKLQDDAGEVLAENEVGTSVGDLEAAQGKLKDFSDTARKAMEKVALAKDKLDEVTQKINDFEADIVAAINDPTKLAGDFGVLFETMDSAFTLAKTAPGALRNIVSRTERAIQNAITDPFRDAQSVFANFKALGAAITGFDPVDTHSRTTRKAYAKTFDGTARAAALGMQYKNAVQRDFGTVDEIDTEIDLLEEEFVSVAGELEPEFRATLATVRDAALSFFTAERLTADRVRTVTIYETSARRLSFRYYGTTERGPQLSALNPFQDPLALVGDVDILTPGATPANAS